MMIAVASTAFLMGLVGGTHCLAMCSAPCGALVGQGREQKASATDRMAPSPGTHTVQWMPRGGIVRRAAAFHVGRLLGYSLAGCLAAWAMDSLAWLTQHTTALRPAWTLMHVAVMAWGVMMMAQARQPQWLENAARAVWARARPMVSAPSGVFFAGGLLGGHALRLALFGTAGGRPERRSSRRRSDHGTVWAGQRGVACRRAMGLDPAENKAEHSPRGLGNAGGGRPAFRNRLLGTLDGSGL